MRIKKQPSDFLKNYKKLNDKVFCGNLNNQKCVVSYADHDMEPIYNIMLAVRKIVPRYVVKPVCYGENFICTQFVQGKSMKDYIMESKPSKKNLLNIIFIVLHTLNVLRKELPKFRHNDLHLDNIMIDTSNKSHPTPVIIDFGLATISGSKKKYLNPSYNDRQDKINYKRDWGIYEGNDFRYDAHYFLNCLYGMTYKYVPRTWIESMLPPNYRNFGGKPKKGTKQILPSGATYCVFNFRMQPPNKETRKHKLAFKTLSDLVKSPVFYCCVDWLPYLQKNKITKKWYKAMAKRTGITEGQVRKTLLKVAPKIKKKRKTKK